MRDKQVAAEEVTAKAAKAKEKLKKEIQGNKDVRVPAEPIVKHLISKCEEDKKFAERVELKDKSLKGCFDYVFNEVKKKLNGVNGWIDDNEVYKMAETYWLLNITELRNIEIKETNKGKNPNKVNRTESGNVPPKKEVKKNVKEILENKQVSIFDIVG